MEFIVEKIGMSRTITPKQDKPENKNVGLFNLLSPINANTSTSKVGIYQKGPYLRI